VGAADPPLAWVIATVHLRNIVEGKYYLIVGKPICRTTADGASSWSFRERVGTRQLSLAVQMSAQNEQKGCAE